MMKSNKYPQYDTKYISGVMSLRTPQEESLFILDNIFKSIDINKNISLNNALSSINSMYPTCSDFERTFLSITFALATGVGKTRLMGAFITYLYTNYGVKNFFIVAPNTTVYSKLVNDFANLASMKYIFKGLGCYTVPPRVYIEDDYKDNNIHLQDSDIRIFIYNIDKFNKETANMRKTNEILGDSFYKYLSELDDLTVIMDESHHYRADKGMTAINELNPMLGIELTATPIVKNGNKQIPFKNVVYEYPLSKAIADGYTRTPFAVTRSDIDYYNFGDEQLDKMMILDGITCHEDIKTELEIYCSNNNKKMVKPFMLIVCKDTDHANWVYTFVTSKDFRNGYYNNKTIIIHSKQSKMEKDDNIKLLLEVEDPLNPIEIVIHVDKLKEGWDVNNLYTIVPLRTAASKILREQMVGRGLRLPFGERTGNKQIDSVMLTAHDKFKDILAEAQKGDSIFKAGNIIKIEEITKQETCISQYHIDDYIEDNSLQNAYSTINIERTTCSDEIIKAVNTEITKKIANIIQNSAEHEVDDNNKKSIVKEISQDIANNEDLADTYHRNENELQLYINNRVEKINKEIAENYIPIPHISVTDNGVEEYNFADFDIDLTEFNHAPIKNELLITRLDDPSDVKRIHGDNIDFDGYRPEKIILDYLRDNPEIDYDKSNELIAKLIKQVCEHYRKQYLQNGLQNIVMMYKRDIANKIYTQMMQHFYVTNGFIKEEVVSTSKHNIASHYSFKESVRLYDNYTQNIEAVLFTGIKKGIFKEAKFQSAPELYFARVIDRDDDVQKWLRPAEDEFKITYNRGHKYVPDFVVETEDCIFLVEIKGEDKLNDPNVLAKKERALRYCEVATRWAKANNYKEWKHMFIPSKQVQDNSSFDTLKRRFTL